MKYFDILGGDVVIHADALAIPCFNDIWVNHKKDVATRIIKYIVLNNHPKSPYVMSMSTEKRAEKLQERLLSGIDISNEYLVAAEAEYLEFTNTLSLQMLSGIRMGLEDMSASLKARKRSGEMSFRDMNDLLNMASRAEKAIKSIQDLEQKVNAEEHGSSRVNGGNKVGYYELPK